MKLSLVWMGDDIFVKWIIVVYNIVFLRVWMICIVMVNISKYVVNKKCFFIELIILCVFWFSINIVVFNIFEV